MQTTFIYSLCCPDSGQIRYVGKSNNPAVRMRRHLANARQGETFHCSNWIRSLLIAGKMPILAIIEECSQADWKEREMHWIETLRRQGIDLTNCKAGGDGQEVFSDETRAKMRQAKMGTAFHKGFKHSDASRARMSESAKAKYQRSPELRNISREAVKHAQAKTRHLQDWQVRKIRELIAARVAMPRIAEQFAVSYSVVESIRWNKNYANVR